MDISNCTYILPHAIRVYIFLCSKKELFDLTVIKSICQLCNFYSFLSFISKKIQKKWEITFWFFIKQKMIKKHPNMKQNPPASTVYSKQGYEFWSRNFEKKLFQCFFLNWTKYLQLCPSSQMLPFNATLINKLSIQYYRPEATFQTY